MFLLLAIVLLLFLPLPWNLVAALASLGAFALEVTYWQRRTRTRAVRTGVENLVGSRGEVVEPLQPVGQVRVLGELWEARASEELGRGSSVRVVALDGLTLVVEAAPDEYHAEDAAGSAAPEPPPS